MPAPSVPTRSPIATANPRALEAFIEVEARYREDTQKHLLEVARKDPVFRKLIDEMPEAVQRTQQEQSTALLHGAILRGEWEAYLENVRMQGAVYAQMGIPTSSWYHILGEYRSYLSMRIAQNPTTIEQVCLALEGMNWLADLAMSQMTEAYLATKEANIRAEQERQREILAGAPDAIITFDEYGIVTSANHEAERTFRWTEADIVGRPWHDLFPEDVAASMSGILETSDSPGMLCSALETEGRRLNNHLFPLELTVIALPHGQHKQYCAFIRDLSGQNKAESDQRLLASIVQASPDAIVSLDQLGIILSWNPGAENMYGHCAEDAIGQDFWTLVGTEMQRPPWLLQPVDGRVEIETEHKHREGHRVDVSVVLAPLRAADGHTLGTAFIARDISERIRAAKDLAEKTHQLERSNRELQEFVYAASHDLRAPLRAVDHLSSFLAEDLAEVATGESLKHLSVLRKRVQHMSKMISDLLEYSRIGHRDVGVEEVDCHALVDEILDAIDYPKTFTFAVTSPLPVLQTQRTLLHRVLANVLQNALHHHNREDGRVEVSAQKTGEQMIEFSISDDGPGIAEHHRERVFRMFQTLSTSDGGKSSGIGLAIVKKSIETVGGTISLENSSSGGVKFVFTWPQ